MLFRRRCRSMRQIRSHRYILYILAFIYYKYFFFRIFNNLFFCLCSPVREFFLCAPVSLNPESRSFLTLNFLLTPRLARLKIDKLEANTFFQRQFSLCVLKKCISVYEKSVYKVATPTPMATCNRHTAHTVKMQCQITNRTQPNRATFTQPNQPKTPRKQPKKNVSKSSGITTITNSNNNSYYYNNNGIAGRTT